MRRISIGVAMAMVAMLAFAGAAFAWSPPSLVAKCAPDANSNAWTITLPQEADYKIDWSFNQTDWTTKDFGSMGAHDFTTPRGGNTLYVRWTSDTGVEAQANANNDLCNPPVIPPSASYELACGTITVTFDNQTKWLYALEFEVDGVLDVSAAPPIANPNDDGPLNVDGPGSATRTYTFAEDSGVHHVRWILRLGAESDYFFGWTPLVAIQSDCHPNDTASLNIKKVDAESQSALNGAVFKIKGISGTFKSGSGTWTVDGQQVPDGTDQAVTKKGFVCIIGLPKDSKWLVTEQKAPNGYDLADPASQLVEVDDDGDCNSPDVVFENSMTPPDSTPTPTATPTSTPEQSQQPISTPAPTKSPEGDVHAATGTPAPHVPDTSMSSTSGGSSAPILLFVVILLGSLGGVAYVNVAIDRKR